MHTLTPGMLSINKLMVRECSLVYSVNNVKSFFHLFPHWNTIVHQSLLFCFIYNRKIFLFLF